jgi:hypothetical protein
MGVPTLPARAHQGDAGVTSRLASSMRGAKYCVRTGPSVAVVSTRTRTTLSMRWSMSRWCCRSKVSKATSVAASVAATWRQGELEELDRRKVIRSGDLHLFFDDAATQ